MDRIITVNDLTEDSEYANAPYQKGDVIALYREHYNGGLGYAEDQMWMVYDALTSEKLWVYPFCSSMSFEIHDLSTDLIMGKVSYRCLKEYEDFYGIRPEMEFAFGEHLKRESKEAWMNEDL